MPGYRYLLTAATLALLLAAFGTALYLDLSGPVRTGPGPVASVDAARPTPAAPPAPAAPSPLAAAFAPRNVPGVVYADLDVPVPANPPAKGPHRPRSPKPMTTPSRNG